MDRDDVFTHGKLTILQKKFLMDLLDAGKEVNVIESNSELISSKGHLWIEQSDSRAYYEHQFDRVLPMKTGVSMVLKDLTQDINIWTPDDDDKEQIRNIKGLDLDDVEEMC